MTSPESAGPFFVATRVGDAVQILPTGATLTSKILTPVGVVAVGLVVGILGVVGALLHGSDLTKSLLVFCAIFAVVAMIWTVGSNVWIRKRKDAPLVVCPDGRIEYRGGWSAPRGR